MDKKILNRIEEKAAKLVTAFRLEMEQCKDEMEYYDLIASAVLFKNLILNHFKDALKQDLHSEEELRWIMDSVVSMSEEISEVVILRLDQSKKDMAN